jgi:hypothetical protein
LHVKFTPVSKPVGAVAILMREQTGADTKAAAVVMARKLKTKRVNEPEKNPVYTHHPPFISFFILCIYLLQAFWIFNLLYLTLLHLLPLRFHCVGGC